MAQQIDLKNLALLRQRIGVPKSTVYQWQHGRGRPFWRLMPQIADALAVPLPDLVEALWREKAGDPCPCGCGGTKVFPENPEARTLAIEIPCAKCGTKRIHKRWKQGRHRRLCPTCATSVERIEFTCVGYQDHDAHLHARTCPRTMQLRPSDVNARQRLKDNGLKSLFDVSAKTYQCNSCAGASRLLADVERRIGELVTKKYLERIKSRGKRIALFSDYRDQLLPNPNGPVRRGRGYNVSELGRQNIVRGQWFRYWSKKELPKLTRFGFCVVCDKLVITLSDVHRFHWSCHQKWEGTQ